MEQVDSCTAKSQAKAKFLVTEDSSKDASSLVQCSQDGVQNCRAVTVDTSGLEEGQLVTLISGSEVEMIIKKVPADRWRGGQHDCQHRDGWRVWQHQAADWLPALHPGGSHGGRECALRQEQRLLQPVRGLSLHSIYVYVEIYTDVQSCTCISIFDHTQYAV